LDMAWPKAGDVRRTISKAASPDEREILRSA